MCTDWMIVSLHFPMAARSVMLTGDVAAATPWRFVVGLPTTLGQQQVIAHAAADDRSVSNWIRRAIQRELAREAS